MNREQKKRGMILSPQSALRSTDMRKLTVAVVLGLLIQGATVKAQTDPLKNWRELPSRKWQQLAVLYAEMGEVEKIEQGKRVKLSKEERASERLRGCVIHLKPLATLTGNFDCALHDDLPVNAYIFNGQLQETDLRRLPPEGARVIVFVQLDLDSGKYSVPHSAVDFFPKDERYNRPGLFPVESFEDPKVNEVIETLHKLRSEAGSSVEK
jgi:hypothetical protein